MKQLEKSLPLLRSLHLTLVDTVEPVIAIRHPTLETLVVKSEIKRDFEYQIVVDAKCPLL